MVGVACKLNLPANKLQSNGAIGNIPDRTLKIRIYYMTLGYAFAALDLMYVQQAAYASKVKTFYHFLTEITQQS